MRRLLLLLPLLAGLLPARATTLPTTSPDDTLSAGPTSAPAAVAPQSLAAQPWYRPHHLVLQTAAGQGLITGGVGYTTGRGHLDVDVLAGYVPRRYSITPMGIFTAKITYAPWALAVGQGQWQVRPITLGAFVSHTVSRGLEQTRSTSKYPEGYYWWSARTRAGGFVGGKLSRVIGSTRYGHPRTLGAYYELGTNDLYLTSYLTNHTSLRMADILTLGFGLKLDL